MEETKEIITRDEFDREMRNLLNWFLKTNAVLIVLGSAGALFSSLFVGDRDAVTTAGLAFLGALGSQLINYILYRQKQVQRINE